MKKKKTIGIGRFVFNIPVALILIIIAMMVLVPVVWVTLSAFKTEKEIISWPPTFIPKTFTLENFVDVQGRIDIYSLHHEFCNLCRCNNSVSGYCE